MAIEILEQPQGNILNAYNNSIIRYGLEPGDVPARSIVTVQGIPYEVFPNGQDFYFNLKPIVTLLINQDKFRDSIVPDSAAVYLKADDSLYLNLDVDIDVYSITGNILTESVNYQYLKSAQQVIRKRYTESDIFRALSPTTIIDRYLTYFEGYPFDLSIFNNVARTITITNQNTGMSVDLAFAKGVSRLFVSNGENDNLGFENDVPLVLGTNHFTFSFAGNSFNVFVDKKPVRCGVHVKWFNRSGGWSYWLFEGYYTDDQSSSETGSINNDFNNIQSTNSLELVTGKSGTVTRTVETGIIEESDALVLSELFTSPKVYIYDQDELQPFTLNDWKEIKVKDRTVNIYRSKIPKNRFIVELELPELITQQYAG